MAQAARQLGQAQRGQRLGLHVQRLQVRQAAQRRQVCTTAGEGWFGALASALVSGMRVKRGLPHMLGQTHCAAAPQRRHCPTRNAGSHGAHPGRWHSL